MGHLHIFGVVSRLELVPAQVYVRGYGLLVIPAETTPAPVWFTILAIAPSVCPMPRIGFIDARYSNSLPGQRGLVFRLFSERQDKQRCVFLLTHSHIVVLITEIHEVVSKPCFPYGRYDFAVGLSSKPDAQHLVEIRVRLAFFRKSLPDDFRVSVRGEKPVWVMLKYPSGSTT